MLTFWFSSTNGWIKSVGSQPISINFSRWLYKFIVYINSHQPDVWESSISPGGGQMAHNRKLAVCAIFLHYKDHKPYQGLLGTLELILIRSRTRPGPSMNPTGTLKWTQWFSKKFQALYTFCILYTLQSLLTFRKHFFGQGTPKWTPRAKF